MRGCVLAMVCYNKKKIPKKKAVNLRLHIFPRFNRLGYRIGLRTIKTGTAVVIALLIDSLRPSALPIFAAIGAIVVMSRTLSGAITAATTQLAGITCGAISGCLFTFLFPNNHYIAIGLGLILLIPICGPLRIGFAVPLSCIVFVSVCLYNPATGSQTHYAISRFLDTSIGLITGFVINAVIKPYNNHGLIMRLFREYLEAYPPALRALLVQGHYPDLSPLELKCRRIRDEIGIFAEQPFPNRKKRRQEAAYLRGCYQLAEKMHMALAALVEMDTQRAPDEQTVERLAEMDIVIPQPLSVSEGDTESLVLNYHLKRLLDARQFLVELLSVSDEM